MEALTFFQPMSRSRHPEGGGLAESEYCIFTAPIGEPITHQRITGDETSLTLELTYGDGELLGELRLRQVAPTSFWRNPSRAFFRSIWPRIRSNTWGRC